MVILPCLSCSCDIQQLNSAIFQDDVWSACQLTFKYIRLPRPPSRIPLSSALKAAQLENLEKQSVFPGFQEIPGTIFRGRPCVVLARKALTASKGGTNSIFAVIFAWIIEPQLVCAIEGPWPGKIKEPLRALRLPRMALSRLPEVGCLLLQFYACELVLEEEGIYGGKS